jgi:V/A-type H+-transporting ATPase subunit I
MESKPIDVFENTTTNIILLCAIVVGVLLIVISMCISIYLGFRNKNWEQAIFGHNGIAGLVLYLSLAAWIVGIMLPDYNYMNAIWVICGIVLPILCIFFAGPLAKAVSGRKDFMPKHFGEYVAENFFEMFEYALSYLSNSMSFLRVGGFILSHAGMMSVVMSLADMTSNPVVHPLVVAAGNIFVICLEGLIVGIQILRLEFYEMFSRFYEGNGVPYTPVTVSYETKTELA